MRTKRRRLWVPLSFGFGTLLVLIALMAAVALTKGFTIFDQISNAHEEHYQVADALLRLRSDLYLAGLVKRDFLLDGNEGDTEEYQQQFQRVQSSAADRLEAIELAFGPERTASVARLRAEVNAYLHPLQESLYWGPVNTARERTQLLRMQLSQRTAALQIATEIESLNREALQQQQGQIAAAEESFRRNLQFISLAGLLIATGVAGFTIFYTRLLSNESEHVQSELRRLSQHVVKVQEHERRSISRELHDEVGQMLTGLRMELANLDEPLRQQSAAEYQRLQEAKRLTEQTLQCVRNLSMLLRPSMLDDLGLSPAVHWQAREFSRRSGIPVDVQIEGEVDTVPDDVRTCLYRVVQEALTNVARHAHAKRIRLLVKHDRTRVSVAIEDDGEGFVVSDRRPQGVGLLGLRERVQELSGTAQITSTPGKGTRIYVQIPVESAAVC